MTYAATVASALPTPSVENCVDQIYKFCEKVLKMPDPQSRIHIDRAHRMGRYAHTKSRAIVVKFSDTSSKMQVKDALKSVNLKGTPYAVFDQFPQNVQERRKALLPVEQGPK